MLNKNSIIISPNSSSYDYIILGAGCSGLSLAVRMIQSGAFAEKKILIIDKAPKTLNDRTWCFWEKPTTNSSAASPSTFFSSIVYHQWHNLWLKHPDGNIPLQIAPYSYKMIRGQDFYRHCLDIIKAAPNVQLYYGEVTAIDAEKGTVSTADDHFIADSIFSSVLLEPPQIKAGEYYLLQHFRGWWIETEEDVFDPAQADLMNFRTSQKHGCAFVYVLPVSPRKALVEYTLFTEDQLTSEEYDEGLKVFLNEELHIKSYTITEVENGVIPMTNLQFPQQQGKVFFIGTAGGQTKASTGYTFQFIQKQTAAIVDAIMKQGLPVVPPQPSRFHFYDSVLLRVLHERKLRGADVFYRMFKKNKATTVLRFLDNETNFLEELAIMNSSKKSIFLPAALKEMV